MDRKNVIRNLETVYQWVTVDVKFSHGLTGNDYEKIAGWVSDGITMLKEQEWNMLTEDTNGLVCGLPGDDGTYLMTDGEDIWIDDYVDGVDDGVWLDSGRDIREIKAWMYMPKLPK